MKTSEKAAGVACLLACMALAAGCVPALNYGSVPPEPEYTTKHSSTTAAATTRKPFTTHSHKEHTISLGEIYGYGQRSTTGAKKSTSTGTGTGTGMYAATHTGTNNDDDLFTGSGDIPHTDMPQSVTAVVPLPDDTDAPDTAAQETPAPEPPPETAAPHADPAPDPEPAPVQQEPAPDAAE